LLYFSGCSKLENTSVNNAKPVATTTKMAIGIYVDSISSDVKPRKMRPAFGRAVGL
jgi:hypothetical protein